MRFSFRIGQWKFNWKILLKTNCPQMDISLASTSRETRMHILFCRFLFRQRKSDLFQMRFFRIFRFLAIFFLFGFCVRRDKYQIDTWARIERLFKVCEFPLRLLCKRKKKRLHFDNGQWNRLGCLRRLFSTFYFSVFPILLLVETRETENIKTKSNDFDADRNECIATVDENFYTFVVDIFSSTWQLIHENRSWSTRERSTMWIIEIQFNCLPRGIFSVSCFDSNLPRSWKGWHSSNSYDKDGSCVRERKVKFSYELIRWNEIANRESPFWNRIDLKTIEKFFHEQISSHRQTEYEEGRQGETNDRKTIVECKCISENDQKNVEMQKFPFAFFFLSQSPSSLMSIKRNVAIAHLHCTDV